MSLREMTKDEAIELQSLMFEASEAIDDLAFLPDLDDIAKGACYGVIIKAGNALLVAAGAKEKTEDVLITNFSCPISE